MEEGEGFEFSGSDVECISIDISSSEEEQELGPLGPEDGAPPEAKKARVEPEDFGSHTDIGANGTTASDGVDDEGTSRGPRRSVMFRCPDCNLSQTVKSLYCRYCNSGIPVEVCDNCTQETLGIHPVS